MTKVLVLGGTGTVGRACLEVLLCDHDIAVTVVGRDQTRLHEVAARGIETRALDITDSAALATAFPGCDVVVNCAGPSHRFSAQVASAAVAAGVPYVDPGGDPLLLERLASVKVSAPVVLQTGVQPGLSGLLLRVLARRLPGAVDAVTAWCGGLQRLTAASVLEYAASLHDSHSHPGAALCDGVIRRVSHHECEPAPARYFSGSSTVRPHLDSETVAVAAHLGIGNIRWMNVFDGLHTVRMMQLLAAENEQPRGRAGLDDVFAAAKLDLFGRQPYFAIVGSAQSGGRSATVAFTCLDSYRVTGAVAAFAARQVTGMPASVRPFWSIDDPQGALEFLTDALPQAQVSFTDDPVSVDADRALVTVDEGCL